MNNPWEKKGCLTGDRLESANAGSKTDRRSPGDRRLVIWPVPRMPCVQDYTELESNSVKQR